MSLMTYVDYSFKELGIRVHGFAVTSYAIELQKYWMKKRYFKLVNRTGAAGHYTDLDMHVLRVMKNDKDVMAEMLGVIWFQ